MQNYETQMKMINMERKNEYFSNNSFKISHFRKKTFLKGTHHHH